MTCTIGNAKALVEFRDYCRGKVTLEQRLSELVLRHGSVRAVGRVLRIDHAYLHRLYHGEKKAPSAAVLKKLGLRRVVTYELVRTSTNTEAKR